MKRYRFKPIIVEAQQWHKGDPPCEGMELFAGNYCVRVDSRTLHFVADGDWIVKEDGRFSITDALTFNLYEPVE